MNAYILVGGRSSRMGSPKSTIPFGGTTMLGRIVEAARGAFDEVIAVDRCGAADSAADELRRRVGGATLETVFEDPHDDEAPIFGVARAIRHANAKCFVIAVDYPLMTSSVLRDLRRRFESSDAPMLVPVWRGFAQVLCAGYSPAMLARIDEQVGRKKYDLQSLVAHAETIDVDGDAWRSVNTPEELNEARNCYERQGLLPSR